MYLWHLNNLNRGVLNGFGDEAINTLVQEMENHRDDVIVIFAGYTDKMKAFLDRNLGEQVSQLDESTITTEVITTLEERKMAQRKSNKPTNFEKSYRILEYLKKNTDEKHRTTQAKLRKVPELEEYIADKGAFNDIVNAMADAMNLDDHEPKGEKEWRLVFDAFTQQYGEERYEKEEDEELPWEIENEKGNTPRRPVKNLFYRQPFSYDEINAIIEGLFFSKTLDTGTANAIARKVEEELTSRFYARSAKNICTIYEPCLADKETLRTNLLTIQKAIDHRVQVAFSFCGYDHNKKLRKLRATKDVVSPYYLVANSGRYYLLACKEMNYQGHTERKMSIWRVDLMRDIEIPGFDEQKRRGGIRALKKSEVKNLPREWNERFGLSHLNMAFDEPVLITLRISSPKEEGFAELHKRPDYTFLHDWFGDTFEYVRVDEENTDYDIVRVKCSPYAMANWALQYSDRVEVISPADVRDAVADKIRKLNEKYQIEKGGL